MAEEVNNTCRKRDRTKQAMNLEVGMDILTKARDVTLRPSGDNGRCVVGGWRKRWLRGSRARTLRGDGYGGLRGNV
jgi:hypothetical protein